MNPHLESKGNVTIQVALLTAAAVLNFFFLFLFQNIGPLDFWCWFAIIICILFILIIPFDRNFLPSLITDIRERTGRKILFGTLSAGIFYAVFFAGDVITRSLSPFMAPGIQNIYLFKEGVSLWRIVALIVLVIGPGEELFWRGFIQKHYSQKFGSGTGYVISVALYTLVHTGSGNVMLIGSACIAGLYWGFWYHRTNSLLLNMVSHVLWDVAVFILFPFKG